MHLPNWNIRIILVSLFLAKQAIGVTFMISLYRNFINSRVVVKFLTVTSFNSIELRKKIIYGINSI